MKKGILELIGGYAILIIGFLWIFDNLCLLYKYKFTSILFLFMFPTWTLLINSLIGFICMIIGLIVIRHWIKIKQGIFISLSLLILGGLLKYICII